MNTNEEYSQIERTEKLFLEQPTFDNDAVERATDETCYAVSETVKALTRGMTTLEQSLGILLGVIRALANLSADSSDSGVHRDLSLAEEFYRSYYRTLLEVRERNGLV